MMEDAKEKFVRATERYAKSFGETVAEVSRERKYLASIEGFPEERTASFVKLIEEENLAQFYAVEDEVVVGWCDVLPKNFEGMRHVGVLGMGLRSGYRNRGIGRRLLQITIDHARLHNGIEKVELEVFRSNGHAISFYEKSGFQHEGCRRNGRKLDGVYDDIILMGRSIVADTVAELK